MQPVTDGAYGGGLYGMEKGSSVDPRKAPASHTQSADGPEDPKVEPNHKPPPPNRDRDVDITGQWSVLHSVMVFFLVFFNACLLSFCVLIRENQLYLYFFLLILFA